MLEVRVHTVMHLLVVSIWCSSHGPAHRLWSGTATWADDEPWRMVARVSDAMAYAAVLAERGELEELTDECGR